MKYVIIIFCMFLTACHQEFSPRQVVMAKEYCKANGMEYYVDITHWVNRNGVESDQVQYRCKDADGMKYTIPDKAVVDKEK